MKLFILSAAALALFVSGASADPISERKELMKERGPLMRVLGPIAQGQQPFDAAAVMDALEKLNANAEAVDVAALWPEGSETGDTKSSPKIWEDMVGYQAETDKYTAATQAAVAANPQDLASFQAAFGPVAASCGACHEDFRM